MRAVILTLNLGRLELCSQNGKQKEIICGTESFVVKNALTKHLFTDTNRRNSLLFILVRHALITFMGMDFWTRKVTSTEKA